MRIPAVAANWKMHGSLEMARALCGELVSLADSGSGAQRIEIIVCPPAILLGAVCDALAGSGIHAGAQDIDQHTSGAYTGQIAAPMVRDAGGSHVIIGHSERRTLFGETDQTVAAKVTTAIEAGLTPIICVGETRGEREAGETEAVVDRQIQAVVEHCGIDAIGESLIAYEPVWAIGTGLTATPEQAQQVHRFIRAQLAAHDNAIAAGCRILYGGSMKPGNAAELLAEQDIDGGLIGGASLNAKDFFAICAAAIQQAA